MFFDKRKDMTSDLNMSHGRMSNFVSFSLFRFNLIIKLGNLDFEIHRNACQYLNDVRFEYVVPNSV